MRYLFSIWILTVTAIWTAPASASLNLSSIGPNYGQSFDSLASSGDGIAWINDVTLPGWSLFRVTSNTDSTPFPITAYYASDGDSTNGRFYSFGTAGSSERALGAIGNSKFGIGSGGNEVSINNNALAGWISASFMNDTGATVNGFMVQYDGEQWRDAGDNQPPVKQTMEFEYGFGTTFGTVASWTKPGGNFNFDSPVFSTSSGPIDGNDDGIGGGRAADLGGTITNLTWQSGQTLWLRWIEWNDNALDAGLAIDSFSFSATSAAVPEPAAALLGGVVSGVIAVASLLRRLARRFGL